MKTYVKDPDALLDYTIDYRDTTLRKGPYLEDGEAIATSAWEVEDGLTISGTPTADTTTTTIWLQGGEAGEVYRVTNRITTDRGRTDDRSFLIQVSER